MKHITRPIHHYTKQRFTSCLSVVSDQWSVISNVTWCVITFTLARDLTAQTLQKHVGWFLIESRHCARILPPVSEMRFYPLSLFLRWVSAPGNRSAILTEPAEKRPQSDSERKTQQRRARKNVRLETSPRETFLSTFNNR